MGSIFLTLQLFFPHSITYLRYQQELSVGSYIKCLPIQHQCMYKPGSEVCHADALSRLPTPPSDTVCVPGSIIGLIDVMSSTPLSSDLIRKHTQRDPVLSHVCP